jgi:hypothetical protein
MQRDTLPVWRKIKTSSLHRTLVHIISSYIIGTSSVKKMIERGHSKKTPMGVYALEKTSETIEKRLYLQNLCHVERLR